VFVPRREWRTEQPTIGAEWPRIREGKLSLQFNLRPGIILSGLVAGEGSMQLSKEECRCQTKKQADGAGALHRVILLSYLGIG